MKRLILFELMLLFLATTFESDSPPGWFQQTLPVNDQINDIFFLDSLTGWVVTDGRTNTNDTGYIMKTTDSGNNWQVQFNQPMKLTALQFPSTDTGYVIGGSGTGTGRIFKTTNGGLNWSNINSFAGLFTDISFINSNTGWICDDNPLDGGLFKTINGGINWQSQLNNTYSPRKLFMLNQDTGWFAGQNTRLYRTTNGGNNWNLQFTFTSGPTDVNFVSKDTGWVTAGPTGIMKTVNGGFIWFSQTSPSTVSGESKLFFVTSSHGYIGAFLNRIIVTKDGLNWGNQTTPAFNNYSVYFTDTLNGWAGTSILIHTTDGGGPFVGIQQISTEVPSDYKLYQNYPNPFNPVTNIKYSVKGETSKLQGQSSVKIIVFDIQGKEITKLVDEKQNPGTYQVDWNASGYPSGVYLYQLLVDNKIENTKKMILLK